jgi:N-acyl amino acid synthase of PEP-CTERM/exosortase system
MSGSILENTLLALREEVSVELADKPALLREAYELRYQVYCVERTFLTGQNGIENDEYDSFSRHAIVRWRQTGEAVGTVRLVLPKAPAGGDDYPIQHLCDSALLRGIPLAATGEVSRFALAKQQTQHMRSMSAASCSLLRLALIQAAVWMSAEAGHTHLLAVMEPTLLRLLRATGMHFVPLGPPVDYHGLRQPVVAELVPTLVRLAAEQPVVWDFVTRGGTLYPASRPRRLPRVERRSPRVASTGPALVREAAPPEIRFSTTHQGIRTDPHAVA